MMSPLPVRTFKRALGYSVCLLALTNASAQPVQSKDRDDDAWRFQLTPYLWMTGLDGHVRPFQGSPTAHVDKSFSEVLENLDAAAFLTGTLRKERYVLQADFSHASTSDSASLPQGLSAKAEIRQTSFTLTGGYNWLASPDTSSDLMAGVRVWDIQANVRVPGLLNAASTTSFVDPIVAARWRQEIAPRWSALFYVDAGGFWIGSTSTWQVLGSINYQVKEDIYLTAGYRHLAVKYRQDGKQLDFSMSGPVIGATFRF